MYAHARTNVFTCRCAHMHARMHMCMYQNTHAHACMHAHYMCVQYVDRGEELSSQGESSSNASEDESTSSTSEWSEDNEAQQDPPPGPMAQALSFAHQAAVQLFGGGPPGGHAPGGSGSSGSGSDSSSSGSEWEEMVGACVGVCACM